MPSYLDVLPGLAAASLVLSLGADTVSAEGAPLLRNPHVRRGLMITAEGGSLVVAPGECRMGRRLVKVDQPATLPVAPAPVLSVTDEAVHLSPDPPRGWARGTRLAGPNALDVNACGSFVPESLTIRRSPGGEPLVDGQDYLVDPLWGHVGIGPHPRVTTTDTVYASYQYSLMRMDTVQVSPAGRVSLLEGTPHVSAPVPPDPEPGCLALAHVFVPYQCRSAAQAQVCVIAETSDRAVTGTTRGRIPRTMAKIRAGGPLKIVCWGDSVTAGGNASRPEARYPDVFVAGLRSRFPHARIEMENISVGGSASHHWLYADPKTLPPGWQEICRFQRVLDARPDLVTIEFVNDAWLTPQQVEETYGDILARLRGIGAEVILITPHFTMPSMMGFKALWEPETRPYVLALRDFARRHRVALADVSARWEHLWKEGIPYITLLHNTINHPDDRGHRLFAEELWKCFR